MTTTPEIDPAILAAAPDPEPKADNRPENFRDDPALRDRDPRVKWPQIIAKLADEGMGPDACTIAVRRTGLGINNRSAPEDMPDAIDGGSVRGGDGRSAGDELVAYLTDVFHMAVDPNRQGTARYELLFRGKQVGRNLGKAEIILNHPNEIRAQRVRAARYGQEASPSAYDVDLPPRVRAASPMGAALGSRGDGGLHEELAALRRDIAESTGRYNAILEREGLGVAPQPAQAPAPLTAAQIAEAVVAALRATGIAPAAPIPGQAPTQLGGQVPMPGAAAPATAGPVAAPPTAAQVQNTMQDPIDALERVFDNIERFDKVKARMRKIVGMPDEPIPNVTAEVVEAGAGEPDAPYSTFPLPKVEIDGEMIDVFGVSGVDGGFEEWVKAVANANPKLAFSLVQKLASKFMRQPVAHGGGASAASQATAEQMANGVAGPTA